MVNKMNNIVMKVTKANKASKHLDKKYSFPDGYILMDKDNHISEDVMRWFYSQVHIDKLVALSKLKEKTIVELIDESISDYIIKCEKENE